MIQKISIRNFRTCKSLDLAINPGTTIIVGDNGAGKSTVLEAIHLALKGRTNGRALALELSPFMFNSTAVASFLTDVRAGKLVEPPVLSVDVFLQESDATAHLRGVNNSLCEDACGLRIQAALDPAFAAEYKDALKDPSAVSMVPTEYYRVDWTGFSGAPLNSRRMVIGSALIDPSTLRLNAGMETHLQDAFDQHLTAPDRAQLSAEYRRLRERFSSENAVQEINARVMKRSVDLWGRRVTLGIDLSNRHSWERGLDALVDDVPIQFAGKGDQAALKLLLALDQKAETSAVVLIEEPETHLSHTRLHELLSRVEVLCKARQVVVATHSAFVLNKLGLENLVLLSSSGAVRLTSLRVDTVEYFKRLPGHDTLRMALCKTAVLVEGPSDELVFQRAYRELKAATPLEHGVDVLSVSTSHKRFLELASALGRRALAIVDNDGKSVEDVKKRFAAHVDGSSRTLHVGDPAGGRTLEPQLASVNDIATLNGVLKRTFASHNAAVEYMAENKTESALAFFENPGKVSWPDYIVDAVNAC